LNRSIAAEYPFGDEQFRGIRPLSDRVLDDPIVLPADLSEHVIREVRAVFLPRPTPIHAAAGNAWSERAIIDFNPLCPPADPVRPDAQPPGSS
jgi:hypothetical protein